MMLAAACLVLLFRAVLGVDAAATDSNLTVDLGWASYEGKYESAWGLNVFLGIRYGDQPRMWWTPQPPKTLHDIDSPLEARLLPPMCIQFGEEGKELSEKYLESEDCLFLNVFAPAHPAQEKLPVLVWIHSGDFQHGRADTDPRVLMKTNNNSFIFVEIQYRLGVFGFLSWSHWHILQEHGGVNNVGLHDQRLALRWVREHIHKFGGDLDRVTLGGHGSGAASVLLQSMAEGGKGEKLFRNAILASPFLIPVNGNDHAADEALKDLAMEHWPPSANRHDPYMKHDWEQTTQGGEHRKKIRPFEDPIDQTLAIAAQLKLLLLLKCARKSDLATEIGTGNCLRRRTVPEIREAAEKLTKEMGMFGGTVLFAPVSEGRGRIGRVPQIGDHWGLIPSFPSLYTLNESAALVPTNMLIGTSHQDGIPQALREHSKLSGDDKDFNEWFERHFARQYQHGLDSMAWEERSLLVTMYGDTHTNRKGMPGNRFYDNTRSVAKGSPELVERFPSMCNERAWSPRQQTVNRILTEVFYHCPAEWTAGASAARAGNAWRYELRHEQNLHGDDLELVLPSSKEFDPKNEKWATRAGIAHALQRMWGNFITQDAPVVSLKEARNGEELARVPIDPQYGNSHETGRLYWPQYPWMMVLDSEGGETRLGKPPGMDFKCPVRVDGSDKTPYLNRFSLANSVTWNDDRGARCRWWQEHGHKIPI